MSWAIVLSLGFANGAGAAESDVDLAKTFMRTLIEVSTHSKESGGEAGEGGRQKLTNLSGKVDYQALAKRTFRTKWTKFKVAERQAFLATFQDLLETVLYPKAKNFTAKAEDLKYEKSAKVKSGVGVEGSIAREKKGEVITKNLEIVLIFDAKSKKIVDAVIEDEQLSTNLNRQFDNALKKKTFAQIIEQMKKRVEEAKKSG